jgi:sugar phosphate isomerase/epimerase
MAILSVNETTTFRWSFEEDVTNYQTAAVPAIGVWRHKLSDCGLARAAELLADGRLSVSHLFWAGGFTGNEGRSHSESIEDAVEAMHTAAAIRCPLLLIHCGSQAGLTFNHARRLTQEALAELAPLAAELNVTLALEPMHSGCAAEWTFCASLDDTLRMLETIGHPRVKMIFDTYHLGMERGIADRVAEIAPHIGMVQLGDGRRPPDGEQNRCRLGEGIVPLPEIIAALKSAGFDGYYDVELLGEEVENDDYFSLLEHAKSAFEKLVQGKANQ